MPRSLLLHFSLLVIEQDVTVNFNIRNILHTFGVFLKDYHFAEAHKTDVDFGKAILL